MNGPTLTPTRLPYLFSPLRERLVNAMRHLLDGAAIPAPEPAPVPPTRVGVLNTGELVVLPGESPDTPLIFSAETTDLVRDILADQGGITMLTQPLGGTR